MKHRDDIDGLRAVAVVPVVIFHANLGIFSGGYVGVDIFFVISGYLITSILASDLDRGTFSLAKFYDRRVRRIFPALFAVLAASSLAAAALMIPQDLREFAESLIAASAFVANIFFWLNIDYFATQAEFKPLLHTWSLSVEEQFYVFFPLFLWAAFRWRRFVSALILIGTACSFALNLYGIRNNPDPTFYLTPFRAWELLLGSILALNMMPRLGTVPANLVAAAGMACIAAAVFTFDRRTPFPGEAALVPCLGAFAIIWAGMASDRGTLIGRCLTARPLVFIGRISYSLYLWHWPILVFYTLLHPAGVSPLETCLLLGLILVVSVLSWRFIELPFRQHRPDSRTMRTVGWGVSAVTLAAIIAIPVVLSRGLPMRFGASQLHMLDAAFASIDQNNAVMSEQTRKFVTPNKAPVLPPGTTAGVLIWGDSHATSLVPALVGGAQDSSKQLGVRIATMRSCRPLVGYATRGQSSACHAFNAAVASYLSDSAEQAVVIAGRWADIPTASSRPTEVPAFVSALTASIDAALSGGKRVFLVGPVPEAGFDVPRYLVTQVDERGATIDISDQVGRIEEIEAILAQVASSTGVPLILPRPALCDSTNSCTIYRDGEAMYFDSHHLTAYGAHYISDLFTPVFAGLR